MKNFWKWFLGTILVLAVVAALLAVPLVMRRIMLANFIPAQAQSNWRNIPTNPGLNTPGGRGYNDNFGPGGMNSRHDFSRQGRFQPFFGGFLLLGSLFRMIFPLGVFALFTYFVYQQGKQAGMRATGAVPPAPPAPATTEAPAPQSPPTVE